MQNEIAFFSYSRNDSGFALKLARDLRKAGVRLWIDQLDIKPGSHWDASIENGLNAANCMIVILSPDSIASNNVMDEVSYALENSKRVIPILWKQCNTPFRLRRLQRVDFTGNYNEGIQQLIEALDHSVSSISTVTEINQPQTMSTAVIEEQPEPKDKKEVIESKPEIKQKEIIPNPVIYEEPVNSNKIDVAELVKEAMKTADVDIAPHLPMAEKIVLEIPEKKQPITVDQAPKPGKGKEIKLLATGFHKQRLFLFLIALSRLSIWFLPWTTDALYNSIFSRQTGPTAYFFIMVEIMIIVLPLIGNRSDPFKGGVQIFGLVSYIILTIWAIYSIIQILNLDLNYYNPKPGTGVMYSLISGILGIIVASGLIRSRSK